MAGIQGLRLSCISLLSFSFLLVTVVAAATSASQIGRNSFPKGFKFGAASSAYQVEGAASEGGRGPSSWDLPQVLEDEYGGFRGKRIADDYGIFADVCFQAFGDRVKYWTTVDEPWIFSVFGYDLGLRAPGCCSPAFGNSTDGNSATEPSSVAHMLLAHSVGVKIYSTKYQGETKRFHWHITCNGLDWIVLVRWLPREQLTSE